MSANNDPLFEAVLRQAVIDHSQDEIERLSTEQEDEVVISELCDQKIKNLIEQKKHSTFGIRRIVVAVIIFIVVSTGVMMAVPQARAAIFDTIAEWMDKRTRFQKNPISEESLLYEPTLLPKGYEAISRSGNIVSSVVYKNEENQMLIYSYVEQSDQSSINNEEIKTSQIVQEGIQYTIIEPEQDNVSIMVMWYMDGFCFKLNGNMKIEDILFIAQSVKKMK